MKKLSQGLEKKNIIKSRAEINERDEKHNRKDNKTKSWFFTKIKLTSL